MDLPIRAKKRCNNFGKEQYPKFLIKAYLERNQKI